MDRQYYIKSGGELVAVTEEVYRAYQQPNWREKKQKEVRKRREESYELMLENGIDISGDDMPIDEIVFTALRVEELHNALDHLSDDERFLIEMLFFKRKSEHALSHETGIPRPTIHSRKVAVLKKLRTLLEENF